MTTTNVEQLSKRIEQVIQEHLAASQKAAAIAVARVFARAGGGFRRAQPAAQPGGASRRRPSAEIAAVGAQLYRVVCEKPGETMAVLAADVGQPARKLHRPMAQLKRQGQVRSVGERHLTRYFPMGAKA